MKVLALFLVLPALIIAKIDIDIIAAKDKTQRNLHISGSDEHIISDEEIKTFQLTKEKLKDAVNSYLGARPDDAYLKSPTPWGDLYLTYQWKQVTRILKPLRARIISVEFKPSLVYTQRFNNTSSKKANFLAHLKQDVENTVSSTWERSGELTVEQNLLYGFDFTAMGVSGKAAFSYMSKWGENIEKSMRVTVGSTTGLEIFLEPNQSVIADLYATKGYMKIQIDYVATLSGAVAVNYNNLYKDHHFWSADVNKVLEAAGLNRSVLSSEVIDLGFYSDSKVDLRDSDTKTVLSSLDLSVF